MNPNMLSGDLVRRSCLAPTITPYSRLRLRSRTPYPTQLPHHPFSGLLKIHRSSIASSRSNAAAVSASMSASTPQQQTMRAIRVHVPGGLECLSEDTVAVPALRPGHVLVRNKAVGINFHDTYCRSGLYPPKELPFVVGLEGAGVVEAVGEGVDAAVQVGDRVAYTYPGCGSYAEVTCVPAVAVVRLPEEIDFETAAACLVQGLTAHYLVHDSHQVEAGEEVLVHAAAGGTGRILTQMAKLRGARVIGTCSTRAKAELALSAGADQVILYKDVDFAGEVGRMTGGRGVDAVYDGVGAATFSQGIDCLARRGTMVLYGYASGIPEPLDLQRLALQGSISVTRPVLYDFISTSVELQRRADDVFGWIQDEQLDIRLCKQIPLEEVVSAHHWLEGRQSSGKCILLP